MRVGFLVADAGRGDVIEATRAAGYEVAAVIVPPGGEALLPGVAVTSGSDDEVAQVLSDAQIEVLVALGGRPPPESPLRSTRWTLLSSHRSLLPRHRGCDPGWHALAEGDRRAGVSVYVVDRIRGDAGPILHQEALDVDALDTFATLSARLAALEPAAVATALRRFQGGATYADQDEDAATVHAMPLTEGDLELDPSRPLSELVDRIRAGEGAPTCAWFTWKGQRVGLRIEPK